MFLFTMTVYVIAASIDLVIETVKSKSGFVLGFEV